MKIKFVKKFVRHFDTKKRIAFGILLLLIMYLLVFINQPIAALLVVFAFFLTLGLARPSVGK